VEADVLIVGAGFAGAATAYHLATGSPGRILVVDMEDVPGYHASGRNASLVLQSVDNAEVRETVAAGVDAYLGHAEAVGYEPVGSLLLGGRTQLARLRDTRLVRSEILEPGDARGQVPLLRGHEFEAALWTPSDGVMDISRLLHFYLAGARRGGCELRLSCRVVGIRRNASGFRVETSEGVVQARVVVNGAGAWAPELAKMLGIRPEPMRSFKRHLFVVEGGFPRIDPAWPFVWSLDKSFYFRPESGGLLFSVCDEEHWERDFVPTVTAEISERLAEVISSELPALEDALQRRVWSCFRTKTPDGGFHLAWSNESEGFLWVAGLGGHGMGASWEVGRRAAGMVAAYLGSPAPATGREA
jgi:D-arginine dehydrogenase